MNEKLQEIKIENYVLIIYIILICTYYYANTIEVNYIKYQNEEDKETYRTLLYIIFGTSLIITLYYTISEFNNLKEINNPKIYNLEKLSVIANILILIATLIYLYIIYKDKNIDLEVTL